MQTSLLFEPASSPVYYNYWFAIIPPYRIKAVVDQLKTKINNLTENAVTDMKAYVTVLHQNQVLPKLMDDKISYYQSKIKTFQAFDITLQGFGFIKKKNVYTLFIKITPDNNWESTVKQFKKSIHKNSMNQAFIPIAKITGTSDFMQIWQHFEHLEYNASFMAEKITLLEKPVQKQDDYKPKLHLMLKKCTCKA